MDDAQEVKSRLDVADVVGEYIALKPAGTGSFKALCPFHQEKSPSFYVNRARQSWHCFGCDKGGDIISFVMDMEGLGFREALEQLAQKAGVTLSERTPGDVQKSTERKRLHEVNDLAARFFRAALLQLPEAEHARAYATSRHIDDLTGDLFRIGYAPNAWDSLTKALIAKGVTAEELISAGLSVKNEERGSVYDRFRDRLMFTIQDLHGNVVGFTGRALAADAKEAKYVNTPETAVYKKSMILYGLDKAKGEIKRQNLAVIVEGNMDVVSSHKVGITNVVCSSGTALTEEQLRLLQRFTNNLVIAFDADAAGMAATLRGLDLARAKDFSIKLITLPPEAGKDPDEAVNKNPALWKQAISEAQDVMDWVFRAAFKNRNIGNPDEKKKIAADVLQEIRVIADPIVRDHWMTKLAEALSVSTEALREALRKSAGDRSGTGSYRPARTSAMTQKPNASETRPAPDRVRDLAERILSVFIIKPELLEKASVNLPQYLPTALAALYNDLAHAYAEARSNGAKGTVRLSDLLPQETLAPEKTTLLDYLVIRADRDFSDQTVMGLERELLNTQTVLRQVQQSTIRQRIEEDMRAAELAGDQERIAELGKQFQSLTS